MNSIKRLLTLPVIFLIIYCTGANAATVDTALTHSAVMNKDIKAVVIKPAGYVVSSTFPVLYLLHGYSGNYSNWVLNVPSIKKLADEYNMIIVCADGAFASWYFDSSVNKESQYETYVSKELVSYIDSHYSTVKNRSGRAITGLSMGGHGALYLAFKYQDVYGAAGSMSGGVDLRPFPDSFGIEKVLGKYSQYPERWKQNSVINMLYLLKPNSLAITFDVGYSDFFYPVNKALHDKMLEQNIPHDFTVRPGAHTWGYWGNSIKYQALFFSQYFNKDNKN